MVRVESRARNREGYPKLVTEAVSHHGARAQERASRETVDLRSVLESMEGGICLIGIYLASLRREGKKLLSRNSSRCSISYTDSLPHVARSSVPL